MRQKDYYEAYIDDYDKVVVYLSKQSYEGKSDRFYMKDSQDHFIKLKIHSVEDTQANYTKYILGLNDELTIGEEYSVYHEHARKTVAEYACIVKTDRFDEEFDYAGNDLGYIYARRHTRFALWAPTAFRVILELKRKDGVVEAFEMKRTEKGVWRTDVAGDLNGIAYTYHVRVNGSWRETLDPYALAGTANSEASVVVDQESIRFRTYSLPRMNSYCDAIIYEASVRDFTMHSGIGIQHPGTFRGFVEENKVTKAMETGFSYLKSLGITHVQLMPVFDFGSVDEIYPRIFYNWGYDPVQYRVLEGSFSTDVLSPSARMREFGQLVEKCHENGIRVNLDVVFNHVYDKNTFSLENIVPNYYFLMNDQGDFSNGSWCGNDIDTSRRMSARYFVDTCVWMTRFYHIDGLRFDLMGILDIATINEIYLRCRAINPDFMVYGEGWNMPSFMPEEQRASMQNNGRMPFVAHFSDRFRDVVKGSTSAYEIAAKGYCTGNTELIDVVKNCLCASCVDFGAGRMFVNPRNVINYVECHDNHTSWDKMRECCRGEERWIRRRRQEMMIAMVLLAQGVPFLHSGQEFGRTKHGIGNSYNSGDDINALDYDRRNNNREMVGHVKQLIRIRRDHSCFRYSITESLYHRVAFDDIERKVLIYKTSDGEESIWTFFNPTGSPFHYHLDTPAEILYYNGEEGYREQDLEIRPYSTIVCLLD